MGCGGGFTERQGGPLGDQPVNVPWSETAEVSVLCALMIDPDAIEEVRTRLGPGDFYADAHSAIYEALCELRDAASATDVVSLTERLKAKGELERAGGLDHLGQILDAVPSSSSAAHHAKIVHDHATRRRLILACQETQRRAMESEDTDELFSEAEGLLLEATARKRTRGFRPVGDAVSDAIAVVERAANTADGIIGIRTGIPKLDWLTAGLTAGEMTVLAGRPSMGKSAMGWQIAENAARHGHGTVFVSYEMADAQLGKRGISRLSGLDASALRRGRLEPEQWKAMGEAASRLSGLPIWTNDAPPHTVEGLRSMVTRHVRTHGTDLVVVDYLQQMSGKGQNRNAEVEHISRGLKRMAMELDVHVLALAQLNRGVEHRSPPRPMLSDLRDSGAIEQDADNVLLLWRPEYYFDDSTPDEAYARWQGKAEGILAKQRDGETGAILMDWDASRLTFTELDERRGAA